MTIAIINYKAGNLASAKRAVETIGHDAFVAERPDELERASKIILPGVGAFAMGMERLRADGWEEAIDRRVREEGRPMLGICLGMQLLGDSSPEGGETSGLGLIAGRMVHLSEAGCDDRVPHAGWNEVHVRKPGDPLLDAIPDRTDFYFVHSYVFDAADKDTILATTPYGVGFVSIVQSGNVWGTQFHPEKSSKTGLHLLRNFIERCGC